MSKLPNASAATRKRNPHLAALWPAQDVMVDPKAGVIQPPSKLENAFLVTWRILGGPDLVREFKFHPKRRWRFDFVHLESRVAIEVEGGIWSCGRHTRGSGFARDCEKYNEAQKLGWKVFRVTKVDATEIQGIITHIREAVAGDITARGMEPGD